MILGASSISRAKIAVLTIVVSLHMVVSVFYSVPGYQLVDEIAYHWSVQDFCETGGFEIANGYDERPSPELVHPLLRVHEGRLYTQYPMIYTIIGGPFYKLAGYRGLALMNSLAFLMVMIFCFGAARRLFGDVDLALDAVLILTLTTFAWEYSQTSLPHMTSTCFAIGAFYLFLRCYYAGNKREAALFALASGVVAGFGLGVRFDGVCTIFALIVPLIFTRPLRVQELTAVLAGLFPGVALLSWTNFVRFGSFNPLSDGSWSEPGLTLAAGGLCAGFLIAATRQSVVDRVRNRKKGILCILAAVPPLLLLVPRIRWFVIEMVLNAYMTTIDLSSCYADFPIGASKRGPYGELIYLGGLKKALLQSLPFLAALVAPIAESFRSGKNSTAVRLSLLTPGLYIALFAYSFRRYNTFDGGACLNMRYYVPCLPFFAILCAYAIRNVKVKLGKDSGFLRYAITAASAIAVYIVTVFIFPSKLVDLDFPLLAFPLILALLILLFHVAGELLRTPVWVDFARKSTLVLMTAALVWSGLVAFSYDYPHHRKKRMETHLLGEAVSRAAAPRSLYFSDFLPVPGLLEKDTIIAFPYIDRFGDFADLLEFHLKKGRRAYAFFPDGLWKDLEAGALAAKGCRVIRMIGYQGSSFGEIVAADKEGSGGGK